MRLDDQRESSNIEDRRGQGGFGGGFGRGGGIGRRGGIAGGGIGVVVVALIAMFFGVEPTPSWAAAPSGRRRGYTEQRPRARPQPAARRRSACRQ
jgi:predicted metalloprotease